jgi:hypothetical protein
VNDCTWKKHWWHDHWETSCGHAFTVLEGTPRDNGMKYCCYCGRTLVERRTSKAETASDKP